MCGICGFIDNRADGACGEEVLREMNRRLSHRGPDDEGTYLARSPRVGTVGLGHRRLKIIDLSAAGRQPMANEDGSIRLVLNGEIYNYRQLRALLQEKGHVFSSETDTETLVHLYEEEGTGLLQRLRGMFAFALWDEKKQLLLLARDRIGKKPLVYAQDGRFFCFASELNSLMAAATGRPQMEMPALDDYLSFGYIPAPLTIYKGIRKLPPGHFLILRDGRMSLERYWRLQYGPKRRISEEDAAQETLRLLEESVRVRLNSDVPLGAFLSGGIDSSAVVALMSRAGAGQVKTFSIGFGDADYDELKFARLIARRYGTDHHEFTVRPNALGIIDELVTRYGEPFADSSCIPTYYVSEMTRRSVTVALNGDGGDELFAGYDRYRAMLIAQKLFEYPHALRSRLRALERLLPDSPNPRSRLRRAKRFLQAAFMPEAKRYCRWLGIFTPEQRHSLYLTRDSSLYEKDRAADLITALLGEANTEALLDRILYTDSLLYLPFDLLVKVDIASMTHALEARSPFLDQELIEFVARLPADYKLRGSTSKYLLKKALHPHLPGPILSRGKMGFGVPLGRWFRGELRDFVKDNLCCAQTRITSFLNAEEIDRIVHEHIVLNKDRSYQIWSLLMLELWHRRFMPSP